MKKKTKVIVSTLVVVFTLIAFGGFYLYSEHQNKRVNVRIEKFNEYAIPQERKNIIDGGVSDYDFKIATEKDFSSGNKVTVKYLKLQDKYNQALSLYFEEKLSISEFDNKLKSFDAIPVSKKDISKVDSSEEYFKSTSHISSSFLYLRNDIRLERLSKKDGNMLENWDSENTSETEKILEMVDRTYLKLISCEAKDENGNKLERFNTSYSNGGSEKVSNKTIVFWVSYDTLDGDKVTEKQSNEEIKSNKNIRKTISEYGPIFSKELNQDIRIFRHIL